MFLMIHSKLFIQTSKFLHTISIRFLPKLNKSDHIAKQGKILVIKVIAISMELMLNNLGQC